MRKEERRIHKSMDEHMEKERKGESKRQRENPNKRTERRLYDGVAGKAGKKRETKTASRKRRNKTELGEKKRQ